MLSPCIITIYHLCVVPVEHRDRGRGGARGAAQRLQRSVHPGKELQLPELAAGCQLG
jgi:hypothetical protein